MDLSEGTKPFGAIVTAGAYVLVEGLLVFMVGPTATGDRLGVVRLGGHREGDESGWACAAREVREEASLAIHPLVPPTTYGLGPPHDPATVRAMPRLADPSEEATPLLVSWRIESDGLKLSVMYLAHAEGSPEPSGEAHGLLLLRRRDVLALTHDTLTLDEFRHQGGRVILRTQLSPDLPLQPFLQFQVLAELLRRDPHLMPNLR